MPWELKPFFPSRRDFLRAIMKFRLRYQRGLGWVADIKYVLALAIFLKVYNISDILIFPITAAGLIFLYALGYADERRGVWKLEAEYQSGTINPVLARMDRRVSKLLKSSVSKNANRC